MRFYLFIALFLFLGCAGDVGKGTASQTAAPTVEAPDDTPPSPAPSQAMLPSISRDMMDQLWNNTDFIDFNFYELPISMSMDNKPAIQNILGHLEPTPIAIAADCKPTGRIYFQKEGEDLGIAEFYLQQHCRCFTFLENGKAAHSNRISDKGMEFYLNSIKQAVQRTQ